MPYVGVLPYFGFTDTARSLNAGESGDALGLQYISWTDSRIVVNGFDAHYGGGWIVTPGDSVALTVINGHSTAWTGSLPGTR
jgi:hypothetical protein